MSKTRHLVVAWIVLVALAAPAQLLADEGDVPTGPTVPASTTPDPPAPDPPAPGPGNGGTGGGGGGQSDPNPGSGDAVATATAGKSGAQRKNASKTASAAGSASVSMGDFFFSPGSVTVSVGDSVTWTNNGQAPHNATGDGIATGDLDTGQSASHTFSSAGSFSYICTIHPQMTGTVTVQAGGSGGGGDGNDPGGATGGVVEDGTGLPNTGQDALMLAGLGAILLGIGLLLRRSMR